MSAAVIAIGEVAVTLLQVYNQQKADSQNALNGDDKARIAALDVEIKALTASNDTADAQLDKDLGIAPV